MSEVDGGSEGDAARASPQDPPSDATPVRREGLREVIRMVLEFASGVRRDLVAIAVLAAVGGFAEAAVLVVIARLGLALANGDTAVRVELGPLGTHRFGVPVLIAAAAGLVLVRMAFQLAGGRMSSTTSVKVTRAIRLRLSRAYLRASWAVQSSERQGRLQEMLSGYALTATNSVTMLATGLVAVFSLLSFLVTALAVSTSAAVAVAVTAGLVSVSLMPIRSRLRRRAAAAAQANLAFLTDATETASHSLEARVLGVEDQVADRTAALVDEAARTDLRMRLLSQTAPVVYQGTALLLVVGTLALVYAAGFTKLGDLGGIVLITVRSLTYGQSLQQSYQGLHSSAPRLEDLRDEIDRLEAATVDPHGDPVAGIGELGFESVWFAYVPGQPVLRDVSFRVPKGEVIGIVGPSGAGKSTLVQLLLRLRDPTSGRVVADGRDVTELALDDWYAHISFVPQDPRLFAGTVAENIRFLRAGVDLATIEDAAKRANLHDEVTAWPLGYDTPVGERGGQLSGGQRQRLCIARALVVQPDILVLDEPTSALDVHSEALIRDTIAGLGGHSTVFVIAHRLSTLSVCDRIMVLLDGELQGFDRPDRLEADNPFYREALELSGLR